MVKRLVGGLILALAALAATASPPATAVIATPPQPAWKELNTGQQQILSPLAADWDRMENFRRKKWLGIVERYPRMSPDEQSRMQKRMREWVTMTPEERTKVRSSYKNFQQLPPEKKAAVEKKWKSYSKLPEEDKSLLKEGKKPVPRPPPPAAPTDAPSAPLPVAEGSNS